MNQLEDYYDKSLCAINDIVSFTINLGDTGGDILPIWNNDTNSIINSTIIIENKGSNTGSPKAALIVNRIPVKGFMVNPNTVRTITMDNIKSIGLIGTGIANIKFAFSLNYKF